MEPVDSPLLPDAPEGPEPIEAAETRPVEPPDPVEQDDRRAVELPEAVEADRPAAVELPDPVEADRGDRPASLPEPFESPREAPTAAPDLALPPPERVPFVDPQRLRRLDDTARLNTFWRN